MSPIAVFDILAFLGFGAALFFGFRVPAHAPGIGRLAKYTYIGAVAIFLLNGASNVLEYTGVTTQFDAYGDYAKVLFVPLVLWSTFSRVNAERLLAAQRAEAAEREESELLTSILETSPAGVIVADVNGSVSFANQFGSQILAEALPGQLDLAGIVRGTPTAHRRVPVGMQDSLRYLAVRCKSLHPAEGSASRAVLVLSDVTDRVIREHEIEEYRHGLEREIDHRTSELMEANRQLQDASDARQDFLARMSHELKTPLNSIIGFSEIMLKGLSGPLTEDQRAQLGMVHSSGTHLLELVNDVLEISRIEAGYSPVSIARVNVCARMGDLVASMAVLAREKDIDLACRCEGATNAATDPDKLDQIVRNLVSNAIKFTDPGGRVDVTVEQEQDSAVVTVADTGIGIAEEDQERIYSAFQQVEPGNRARREGTGLGLTICRELCDSLGCTLSLESRPGEGSAFTVRIPRQFPGDLVIL